MNIDFLPNAVTTRLGGLLLKGQKHSPKILLVAGAVLGAGTVVSACRGTLQLEGVLDDIRRDREDLKAVMAAHPEKYPAAEARKIEAYITIRGGARVARLYLPALSLGVAAVACLAGSHSIMARRNAGLSAALAMTERAFGDYRGRVAERFGPEHDRELMFGSEEEKVQVKDEKTGKTRTEKVVRAGDGRSPYARIWGRDTSTEWEPESAYNIAKLRSTQEYCTMRLQSRGHLFLNEVFDELGLDRTSAGAVTGWVLGKGDDFVDFGVMDDEHGTFLDFMTGREEHILLDFNVAGEIWRLI